MKEFVDQDPTSLHTFKIDNAIDVNESVVQHAKHAISMVWDMHTGNMPTGFNIGFYEKAYSIEGKPLNICEGYDPDADRIAFIINPDSMQYFYDLGLTDEMAITINAAHATVHKLQHLRSNKVKGSHDYTFEEYINLPEEEEAWRESLEVFTAIFPGYDGKEIGYNKPIKMYNIPKKGKYN